MAKILGARGKGPHATNVEARPEGIKGVIPVIGTQKLG